MTAPPPLLPGYPPPPPGGYPPPPPLPVWEVPKETYTSWFTRLLAFIVPMLDVLIVGGVDCYDNIYGSGSGYCSTDEVNS